MREETAVDQAIRINDMEQIFGWQQEEEELLEYKRQALRRERHELERDKKRFEREKRSFFAQKRVECMRLESERRLFDEKWRILESELKRLAEDRQRLEKQRRFYECVDEHERRTHTAGRISHGIFFAGVADRQTLKKRYKDLLKIFHPDNACGDVATLQEINREYERLSQELAQ